VLTRADSSKLASQTPVHGGRGSFLSSLSAMSLLSVTSHHRLHHSHNTITMHKSTIVSRQTPSPPQLHLTSFPHGTSVTVRDLFGNMPVRVKQRAMSAERPRGNNKEWEELRRDIVLLLLAWPKSVAVTVREAATNEKLLIRGHTGASTSVSPDQIDLAAVCAILLQSSLISIEDKPFWVSARASTPKMAISAAISLIPSATKHTQFIAFGIQPLPTHDARSMLHDEVNRMFLNSAFGNDEKAKELNASELSRRAKDKRYKADGFTNKELKGGKKGVDRWPMFYINIQQDTQLLDTTPLDIDGMLDNKGSSLTAIMELLQVLLWEFLTKHHFRPKTDRSRHTRQTAHEGKSNAQDLEASQVSAELTTKMHSKPEFCSSKRTTSESKQRKSLSLAAHVKSTSSQQPSSSDAPFNAWTRVKSGSRPLKLAVFENVPQISDASNNPRPFSAPPSSTSRSSTPLPTPNNRPATPLLSSKGELIRRPFEEVATPPMKHRASTLKPSQSQESCSQQGEDSIPWINPATKVKSLVNQRTGLTLRADNLSASNSKNASYSSLRTHPCSQAPRATAPNTDLPSPWLGNLLKTWNNPIFSPAESAIPQVLFDGVEAGTQEILHGRRHYCSQVDIDRAFKQSSAGVDGRISKLALSRAEVISQVDNKFILVKLKTAGSANTVDNTLLVLIDQHAADERIRIETLLKEFFGPRATDTSTSLPSDIPTSDLDKAINFEISLKESRLLCKHKEHFVRWGIIFDLPNTIMQPDLTSTEGSLQRLTVRSLPPGIIERCKLDPKLLIDLIRTEVWKVHDGKAQSAPVTKGDWLQYIHSCPRGIIDMLNSRACRSAIMFNDELSKEQCQMLVSRLASCKLPFQCAHGRPSLVPLANLGLVEMGARGQANNERLGVDLSLWKRNIK
jgi:DNA mismatch repair protein MLH3